MQLKQESFCHFSGSVRISMVQQGYSYSFSNRVSVKIRITVGKWNYGFPYHKHRHFLHLMQQRLPQINSELVG